MKDIIHNYKGSKIRTVLINSAPYFCAADIGKVLELKTVHRQIMDFEKGRHTVTTLTKGGNQEVIYINESNLYRLIFKSRKKEAKEFQAWIFEEVLPCIRKTGQYSIPKSLKNVSTKNRNLLTNTWKECGIEKKHHFIQLTLQEYKALGIDKKKKDMTRGEILLLSALESMEALKLFHDPKDNYYDCKESLYKTAKALPENKELEKIKGV